MTEAFAQWKSELLFTGNIVQDSDDTVSDAHRQQRFIRYTDLLEAIDGTEGIEAARAIIQSMQAKDDYGAYQTTQRALGRFPSAIYLQAVICELPALIDRQRDWAGELLCGLANSVGTKWEPDIKGFNDLLGAAPQAVQRVIKGFISREETDGWLDHRVGVLGSSTEDST